MLKKFAVLLSSIPSYNKIDTTANNLSAKMNIHNGWLHRYVLDGKSQGKYWVEYE